MKTGYKSSIYSPTSN